MGVQESFKGSRGVPWVFQGVLWCFKGVPEGLEDVSSGLMGYRGNREVSGAFQCSRVSQRFSEVFNGVSGAF